MAYEGSVELISGIKTKNNGTFPLVNAHDVYMSDNQRLDEAAAGFAVSSNPVFTGSISLGRKANTTIGSRSFAVGSDVEASALRSHAEGASSKATANDSHAEGAGTTASGMSSHAENSGSEASGESSHAEGYYTKAAGITSHAEGTQTNAYGSASHSEGIGTYANKDYQHVSGKYNVYEGMPGDSTANGTFAEIVGNGTGSYARSNARALTWTGDEYIAGDLYVQSNSGSTSGSIVATKAYVDNLFSSLVNATGVSF